MKFRFDEFGFRVEEEDGPEQNSKKLLGIPFVEDPQHRLVNLDSYIYIYIYTLNVRI
jgi:hypothetical protein